MTLSRGSLRFTSLLRLWAGLAVLAILGGCDGAPAKATKGDLQNVVLARRLSKNMAPVEPTRQFPHDAPVCLSAEFKGRPRSGVVSAALFYGDRAIVSTSADFAELNRGVIASVGESTFTGFRFTHEEPFPISKRFRIELSLDGDPLGTYPFEVVPPPDAIESKLHDLVLARNADENQRPVDPTTIFSATDSVYAVGRGDFGERTWLTVRWRCLEQPEREFPSQQLTWTKSARDQGFYFLIRPETKLPTGKYEVAILMNDEQVARREFVVQAAAGKDNRKGKAGEAPAEPP